MDLAHRVDRLFAESQAVQAAARETLASGLAIAVETLTASLLEGGKILVCGNGGSAAQAQHFACELIEGYEAERQGLAAVVLGADCTTLSAIANDHGAEQIFSRQIAALAQPGDILVVLSTSGNSRNIVEAVKAARAHDIPVIALTGEGGGEVAGLLGERDLLLAVPDQRTPRIQETHQIMLHCLCDGMDALLLGLEI